MAKRGQKDLYFSTEDINQLHHFGVQGEIIADIIDIPEVTEAIRYLNLLAMKGRMYPTESPLHPFTDFDLEDTRLVILGGTPSLTNLPSWLGHGYSYCDSSKIYTKLHEKIFDDFLTYDRSTFKPSFESLHANNVLMLYEVMSTTKSEMDLCLKLWEPFIWNLVHKLSKEYPTLPFVITSPLADLKFGSALTNSQYVFRANLLREKKEDNLKIFPYLQNLLNKDMRVIDEIDFIKELRR